jgi:energy-coupling factor transporter ATP-binding protein EcfA2
VKHNFNELTWKTLIWPRPLAQETVHDLLTHLAATVPRGPVVFETRGGVKARCLLGAERQYIGKITDIFRAHSEIQFLDADDDDRNPMTIAKTLKVSHPVLSLRTDIAESVIRAGLAAIADKTPYAQRDNSDEEIVESVIQVVLGPSHVPSPTPKELPDPHANWLQILAGNVGPATAESRTAVRDKASQHGFSAAIRIGTTKNFACLSDILSAFKILETAGVRIAAEQEKPERIDHAHVPWHFPLRLSVKELVSFLLPPLGEAPLQGIADIHPRLLLPPAWYINPSPVYERSFAVGLGAANKTKLSISPSDALEHLIVTGPTGSGKSTLLQHLILADIRAGRSVLVLDPKADLVNDILAKMPKERTGDVVVIDPTDAVPVGFNPLAFARQDSALIADAVLAVLKSVFADNWGILSDEMLSAALLTLAQTKSASLLWLPALLTNDAFRRKMTADLKDRIALKPFWEGFDAMKDGERRREIAPTLRKIRQYLFRQGIRGVLGQANPKFSLDDLFQERRVVLVPLNKGIIGAESAKLLGSLIVGLVWTLALARAKEPPERRHIVNVFIDELQDYIALPTDLGEALAQARGLGIGLTMAHQYRGQLPPGIRAGIDANARNKIAFGLNISDAKDMAAMSSELSASDFTALPRFRIYASFMSHGKNTGWVSGRTLSPPPSVRMAAELKAQSMATYGKSVEEVETEYLAALSMAQDDGADSLKTGTIGRRKRQ